MIITEEEFNNLSDKEKKDRVIAFNNEVDAYSEAGCPIDISLLIEKAYKYNLYIPKFVGDLKWNFQKCTINKKSFKN